MHGVSAAAAGIPRLQRKLQSDRCLTAGGEPWELPGPQALGPPVPRKAHTHNLNPAPTPAGQRLRGPKCVPVIVEIGDRGGRFGCLWLPAARRYGREGSGGNSEQNEADQHQHGADLRHREQGRIRGMVDMGHLQRSDDRRVAACGRSPAALDKAEAAGDRDERRA